jgi:PPP family 3-phenylpropionic acid transporter
VSLFTRLSSSYFWYFSILGLVTPFMAVFLSGKGFTSLEIGEMLAIVTATKILGPSLWAIFADKSGKQLPIVRLGALLACMSFVFLFWINSYWTITFSLALFTLFWTAILPQLEVLTLNSIRRSGKIYARIRLWGSIGFIVLAVLAGEIIDRFSSDAFTYLGFFILLGLYGSTLLLKQPRAVKKLKQEDSNILHRVLNKGFIVFFMAGLMLQLSFGPYYSFFAMYLGDLSYPGYAIGLLIGVGVVAEIVIFIIAGELFKRFSLKNLIFISMLFTSIRWYFVSEFGSSLTILLLTQLIHAASFGLYHSASIQYIQQHFASDQQSRGQAIYIGGVYGIGGTLGAYFSGVLWLDGLGAQNTFLMAAVAAFIGSFFAIFIPKVQIKKRKKLQ